VGFLGDTVLWTGDFTAGVWHQIAIHVHWSTDENVGRVDFWLDGVQVVTDEPAKTKADGNTLFFQTGMHRSEVGAFTETVYIDNFIEADTLAEAQIMAPMMAGGGAGGAGGTGGAAGAAGVGGIAMPGGAGMGGASAGMGGMSAGGAAGAIAAGGTVGTPGGAAGAGGTSMAAAGMAYGLPVGPTAGTAGSAPVAMPASSTSSSSSGCAYANANSGRSSVKLFSFALFALTVMMRRRRQIIG
jgi:hypothetical protein